MKKLLWKQMWQRLSICMTCALLALGIATGLGGTTSVQAAEAIPISSAEDFMNIPNNPSGSYYLTKDITLPQNMEMLFPDVVLVRESFTGTLDGKGHKLKYTFQSTAADDGWMHVAIFGRVKNATFKNLTLVNEVNVDAGEGSAGVRPLVYIAENCKFDKIKVSGTITVKASGSTSDGSKLSVCGLTDAFNSKLTDCSSSIKIKVSTGYTDALEVGGLATSLGGEKGNTKNCSFSGEISASVKNHTPRVSTFTVAGISAEFSSDTKISGCKNSGNITIKGQKTYSIAAYGIGGGYAISMSSCGNTGKIKAVATGSGSAEAAGLVEKVPSKPKAVITKCWNKGSVSATGEGAQAGGICIDAGFINQCYNKGTVSASGITKGEYSEVGGLCKSVTQMQNCYNVGKVTLKGSGYAGGLASFIDLWGKVSTGNYSTGAVSVKNGGGNAYRAALFPSGDLKYALLHPKCYVYNNYYTASTGCKAYGHLDDGNTKKTAPRATKVSSITSKSCPKLSSKYWTYSSKYKRMVLKNNKEK